MKQLRLVLLFITLFPTLSNGQRPLGLLSAPIFSTETSSKNRFLFSEIPMASEGDRNAHLSISSIYNGLFAFNPNRPDIHTFPATKYTCDYNWYPVRPLKQQLVGILAKSQFHVGAKIIPNNPFGLEVKSKYEFDYNFHIEPDMNFKYLLDTRSVSAWCSPEGSNDYPDWVEGELTSSAGFRNNNKYFKLDPKYFNPDPKLWAGTPLNLETKLQGKRIGIYGPYVAELLHAKKPEIHPSELIWFNNDDISADLTRSYTLLILQDIGEYFNDKKDFTIKGNIPEYWKPWSQSPIVGQFNIPFEINMNSGVTTMDIISEYENNIQSIKKSPEYPEFDQNGVHELIVDNKVVLRVKEQTSNYNNISIQFSEVKRLSNGNIIGYVQVISKVGDRNNFFFFMPDKKGYHAMRVDIKDGKIDQTNTGRLWNLSYEADNHKKYSMDLRNLPQFDNEKGAFRYLSGNGTYILSSKSDYYTGWGDVQPLDFRTNNYSILTYRFRKVEGNPTLQFIFENKFNDRKSVNVNVSPGSQSRTTRIQAWEYNNTQSNLTPVLCDFNIPVDVEKNIDWSIPVKLTFFNNKGELRININGYDLKTVKLVQNIEYFDHFGILLAGKSSIEIIGAEINNYNNH